MFWDSFMLLLKPAVCPFLVLRVAFPSIDIPQFFIVLSGRFPWPYLSKFRLVLKNFSSQDFAGGSVVGNPPANAGDTGLNPGLGRSHMPQRNWACAPQLLSLRNRARAIEPASHNYWAHVPPLLKPARLEPVLHNGRGHRSERPEHRNEEGPPLTASGESPRAAVKTQRSQK